MSINPLTLQFMDEVGYNGITNSEIERVTYLIKLNRETSLDEDKLRDYCIQAGVNPNKLTYDDYNKILNSL